MMVIFLIAVCLLVVCNTVIVNNANGKMYSNADSIPMSEVGLLLGTTPQTRIGGWTNYFFKYRIDAAEALYKSGKVEYILISGDENSLDGINEVECMRDSLVKRGIPESDIMLDGKGFRTLDAVVRAVKLYDVHSFVVISQKFHNERAVYLAEHLELDVHDIMGFNAKASKTKMALMTYAREYFARVKVFLDILTHKEPISLKLDERYIQKGELTSLSINGISLIGKNKDEVTGKLANALGDAKITDEISDDGERWKVLEFCSIKFGLNICWKRSIGQISAQEVILFTSHQEKWAYVKLREGISRIYGIPYVDDFMRAV